VRQEQYALHDCCNNAVTMHCITVDFCGRRIGSDGGGSRLRRYNHVGHIPQTDRSCFASRKFHSWDSLRGVTVDQVNWKTEFILNLVTALVVVCICQVVVGFANAVFRGLNERNEACFEDSPVKCFGVS